MEKAYKSECRSALIMFLLATALTHVFPIYFLFPGLTESTIFGFPTHYFFTMIVGWLVLIPAYWIYIEISEKIEDEIRETSTAALEAEEAKAAPGKTTGGA